MPDFKKSRFLCAEAPVVEKVDNAIRWINLYPVDSAIGFPNTYPLDSDLERFSIECRKTKTKVITTAN